MVSKSCELPDLSKCECTAMGRRHSHQVSRHTKDKDKKYQEALIGIRESILFACDHSKWLLMDALSAQQLLKSSQLTMCERYKRYLHDNLTAEKQSRREIHPERGEVEQGAHENKAYPTEARMRQKAKGEEHQLRTGEKYKPKKREKVIQPGSDDCGEDISSLENYVQELGYSLENTSPYTSNQEDTSLVLKSLYKKELDVFMMNDEADLNPSQYFWGSHVEDLPEKAKVETTVYENFTQCYETHLASSPEKYEHDVFELCGGDERTSKVLIRRRSIRSSRNFDLLAGIDLLNHEEVRLLFEYIDKHKPICGILSPPCTGLAGFSDLNKIRNPVGWWKSAAVSVNLGYLAGMVVAKQLREGRHFICENPAGSLLFDLPPWQELARDHRIHRTVMHQCAAGLRDQESQLLIKKPTEFWASDYCLIEGLSRMQCRCTEPHAKLEGTYRGVAKTHLARVWPWKLASTIANGVSALIQQYHKATRRASRPGKLGYKLYPIMEESETKGTFPPFE